MAPISAFSVRNIATRERLEDYAADASIATAGGLNLQIAIVCDGAGGGEVGELAARLTARTILGYLEISTETYVPKLLVRAVEEANRVVFGELHGTGTSTVALACIHLDDHPPYGRLYLASVGNSPIYLLRDGKKVRLNIDHNLASEYVYAGQMSFDEARQLENAEYMTRVIGVSPAVQVDIGFYAERGKNFVNSRRAFRIGQHGMLLRAGDTILVTSDGWFDINPEDKKPFLHEEELLRHALDDDVERAARAFVRYATTRRPEDNVALSMLFVPSRERKAVHVGIELTRRQRVGLGAVSMFVVILAVAFAMQLSQSEAQDDILQETQAAIAEIIAELSYTPTATHTRTPTPTRTPTSTPTLRPTVNPAAQGVVGFQFFRPGSANESNPILERRAVSAPTANPEISYLSIEGERVVRATPDAQGTLPVIDSADFFIQPQTIVEFISVDDTPNEERVALILYPDGDLYAQTGQFAVGGVEISMRQDTRITFLAYAPCIAARQIPANPTLTPDAHDQVAITCYSGVPGDCHYRFSWGRETPMPIGQRVVLDIQDRDVEDTGPILYEEAKLYYDTVTALVGEEQVRCVFPYLDNDADGIRYPLDLCPDNAGPETTAGCPDQDQDGVPDTLGDGVEGVVDQCPNRPGPPENAGCPLATPTPLPDSDGDGVNDAVDRCPLSPGPSDNNGCPRGTNP